MPSTQILPLTSWTSILSKGSTAFILIGTFRRILEAAKKICIKHFYSVKYQRYENFFDIFSAIL